MTLIGQDVLRRAGRQNAPRRKWLAMWAATVENARWHNLNDIRKAYPTADGVKLKSNLVVTVFNVKGNAYRLLAAVEFEVGFVEVLEVMTHAEYDKERWKDRY